MPETCLPTFALLPGIDSPDDLRRLEESQLPALAAETRAAIIAAVSRTGGHLGAGLGVVELTIALHYVFDTPRDRLIWDVGHQSYPHKLLTGRRDRLPTLRQGGGLSGFTRRAESPYDPFGAGHSSTSISAALGMAVARDLDGADRNVIAVIGDGAMSAGMAWEAMNNAGARKSRLIVILNDNDMSIAPPVGAVSAYLSRLLSSRPWLRLRGAARKLVHRLPERMERTAARAEEFARGLVTGGTLFEELGFYYIGPIDGHSLSHLLPVLRNVRDAADPRPFLIHVVTRKGEGYPPAEQARDRYHGVSSFDVATGAQRKTPSPPSCSRIFGETLTRLADRDPRLIAITAAMPSGTGVDIFRDAHPTRAFDVGIAEQHAVTFAAGLAAEGYRPFVALYATFLQRAWDQVIHDVAIQSLPVRFAIDRAGYVGADGATHCGAFDLTALCALPGFVVMAPADEADLARMIATAAALDECPSALRYPRGALTGIAAPEAPEPLEVGKGRIIREGQGVAILTLGARLQAGLAAAAMLEAHGVSATVADARFAKPLDVALTQRLAREHAVLIVVEDGAGGGFSSAVTRDLLDNDLTARVRIRVLSMPDRFLEHDTLAVQYRAAGLDADAIAAAALDALQSASSVRRQG